MKTSNTSAQLLSIAALIATCAAAAPAAIVTNGDFETDIIAGADQADPATVPSGWSFSGTPTTNQANLRKAGPLTTTPVDNTHGNFWFQNNNAGNTSLLTQVTGETIIEGLTYTLTFDIGEQNNQTAALGRVLLYGGTTGTASPFAELTAIDAGATSEASKWTTLQLSFVATAGQAGELLGIALGLDPGTAGNTNYDNVSLSVVGIPTPAALPAGLTMLGLAAMRRRR